MPVLRFHHLGDWDPSRVRTAWVPSTHAMPTAVRELVDEAWWTALARPGVKLFDGPMCRMESWAVRDGRLELAFSPTSYKPFLGTNLTHPELAVRYGPGVMANPAGVSPALETADGFLLMGRRNDAVAYYPGRVHPFAGCLEPGDVTGPHGRRHGPDAGATPEPPDVFAAVRRELAEELSLADADVSEVRCTGIVEDVALRQPELIFRVTSPRTRGQIEAGVARDEHHASVAIPATPDGLAGPLRDPRLTPVGLASLLLWGRVRFGDAWFEEQSAAATR